MNEDGRRRVTKDQLLQFYRGTPDAPNYQHVDNQNSRPREIDAQTDVYNIDGQAFNTQLYMEKHLREKDLSDLVLEEKVLAEQIRNLDSEMQTLMYDNYSKFISATDTIQMMKADFKYVENEMNCLVKNMASIGSLSEKIKERLLGEQDKLKTLSATQHSLNKLKHLVELPGRLRTFVLNGQWESAVEDLNQTKLILKMYHTTPSFKTIRKDCFQVVVDIQRRFWAQFERATDAGEFYSSLKLLKNLGLRTPKLSSAFVESARDRLQAIVVDLQVKALSEEGSSSDAPDRSEQSETAQFAGPRSTGALQGADHPNFLRVDMLHFANSITESLLNELCAYVTAYTNLFAATSPDDEVTDTILEVLSDQPDSDGVDLSATDLENHLADLVEEVMGHFFRLTEERFSEDQPNCPDTAILVRALDRIHGRVQTFLKTFTNAVHSMGVHEPHTDTTGELALSSNGTDDEQDVLKSTTTETFGDRTKKLCARFAGLMSNLVNTVSLARMDYYLSLVCQGASECITEARQQLINPGLPLGVAGADAPGHLLTSSSLTTSHGRSGTQLSTMLDTLNYGLTTQIRNALKALEIFLNPENTFTKNQNFSAHFCLVGLRERLVVGYMKFLLRSLDDLAKTAAGRVPSTILLLLAKLSLTWAHSGSIGHLLTIPEEMLSQGQKPWSPSFSRQNSVSRPAKLKPTTPKELNDQFRDLSITLLSAFVRLEGTSLAQLLRKSVEARDWLKNLEPRSVRSVVKRVIEDLNALDKQIAQLLPSNSRNKDRMSDSRSGRSGASSLRPSGSSHFLEKHSRSSSTGIPPGTGEMDPSLATQIRRLFTQRVDIFAPVEPNRESLLLGVIKIGLKTLVECVRLQTFGKFGLQQIQVDCRYLQIHLWHFVSDEKLVGTLLDDVLYSVVNRCVDPQLMEDSIVDAICDRA
ncbi:Vacuolar protein sorting-associated protein 51 [Clonorchis sinensis]|uniref:Vacuolar protein sorting-associated protein 51 homolog n=1 Tax=Clonorchis sinensis TaxID=79923 RepID=A0A8T1M3V9_CLOSI|nr:Vacuolar protein sorting-associated protein 51 [Clonorchis sinensis]